MTDTTPPAQVSTASTFDIDLPFTSYDASHPLHFSARPCDKIDGFWYIIGSSLPLWKSKKSVVIRYIPHPGVKGDEVKFTDEIRSERRSKTAEGEAVQASGLASKWKKDEGWFNKAFGIKGTNVLQKDAKNG